MVTIERVRSKMGTIASVGLPLSVRWSGKEVVRGYSDARLRCR